MDDQPEPPAGRLARGPELAARRLVHLADQLLRGRSLRDDRRRPAYVDRALERFELERGPEPECTAPSGSILAGVSCSGPTSCFAVGVRNAAGIDRALIERWNGTSWSLVSAANPATGSVKLSAVSCATGKSCFAVGQYETGPARTLIERWNGTSWTIGAGPTPNAADIELNGVSCVNVNSCFAAGNITVGGVPRTLIERWDGGHWSIVPSPNRVGATSSLMFGVACAATNACFAVGASFTPTAATTLIERWNGTSWTIGPSPNPDNGENQLLGVACVNRNTCTAVGSRAPASGRTRTLVANWNGTRWTGVPSPIPSVATSSHLLGVACSVATSCFAVGDFQQAGLAHILIERHSLHAGYWMVDANGHLYAFGDAGVATPPFPGHPVAIGRGDRSRAGVLDRGRQRPRASRSAGHGVPRSGVAPGRGSHVDIGDAIGARLLALHQPGSRASVRRRALLR